MKVLVDKHNCLIRFLKKNELKSDSDTEIFCRINSSEQRTDTIRVVQRNDIDENVYNAMLIWEQTKDIDQLTPKDKYQQKLYVLQHVSIFKEMIAEMTLGQKIKVISNGESGPKFEILK